ncbi:MAG: cell envelope integrity protein TolA [Gammaproteobacteria bacterium SHHR-1]|uniref:cell envelope integrity protein TolA n=1 Tax=Magnetovirga frankeli TaxID=947516 RepID=UPI0012933E99|nr:cell envelope integrity protein TolA [gamma proteobacterium SS-5]
MLDLLKRSPRAFALALLMHLLLIIFLLLGVDWLVQPEVYRPQVEVVQAKVVDEGRIAAEAARLRQEQEKRQAEEQAARQRAEQELRQLEQKKQREQQRLQQLEQQRLAEEKKRQAEEQRQRREAAEAAKKAKAKAEAERKAKAEAERKAKAEAERKAKAEAERKAKAAQEAERQRREAELQQALEAEQHNRAINAFAAAVSQSVTANWTRPPGSDQGLTCKLRIRLSEHGNILAVTLAQGSGNTPFDRSAEAAVWKSDPLPAPPAGLRDINFTFDPDAP